MKLIDWIAIFGALAWTPHLITLIRNYITKPEVRVIASRTVSLGFTSLGSIFNLHLAFSVKNRDIVISGLKIRLKHNSGEEKLFEWQGIQQQVMKMRTPDGSVLPYEKEQSVLAMKLKEKDIEERFIQFQEQSFQLEKYKLENKLVKNITYQRSQDKFVPGEFMKCQDMLVLFNYIKQSFSWKVGTYEVTIEIESPEKFEICDNKYKFMLTPVDIEELEKNKNLVEHDYKNQIVPQSDDEYETVNWAWRNPTLHKN